MVMSPVLQGLFDQGQKFVISAGKRKADGSKSWHNELHDDLDKAEAVLRKWARAKYNTYVKFACFDGELNAKGRPITTLDHVTASRTFFADVDYGEDRDYATLAEARAAIDLALADLDAAHVPRPNLLQETGNGLQLCWMTEKLWPKGEWLALNGVLYGMLRERGLKLDIAAKAGERGVRMCGPEFPNVKDQAEPKPTRIVHILDRIPAATLQQALQPYKLRVVPTPEEIKREYGVPGGFEFHVAEVVGECEVLKDADATQGAGWPYPRWADVMALCARDDDAQAGREWAQWFSSGHPDYIEAEVDKKLASYRQSGTALVTCRRFYETFPEACGKCRHRGLVNSCGGIPKRLRHEEHNPPEAGALPEGWFNKEAGLYVKTKDGDELVWPGCRISTLVLAEDRATHTVQLSFEVAFGQGDIRAKSLDMGKVHDPKALARTLAGLGMPVTPDTAIKVFRTMVSWMEKLRRQHEVQQHYTHLGWMDGEFVMGGVVYGVKGPRPFHCTDRAMLEFQPHGDPKMYDHILTTILGQEARPQAHALYASGFAGPLVELGGGDGMSLNFFSPRSGVGKSLLGRLSTSGLGHPNAPMLGGSDTANAVFGKMARLHSLTLIFDDPEVEKPVKQYRSYIANASRGAEKQRLTADAKPQEHGRWKTILVFLSNQGFSGMVDSERLAGDATAARFLDFEMPPLTAVPQGQVTDFIHHGAELERTYGHLGPLYIDRIVRRQKELKARLHEWTAYLIVQAMAHPDDVSGRFQAVAGACLIVAAEELQALNVPVDPDLVILAVELAVKQSCEMRRRGQNRIKPESVVIQFCQARMANRVVTVAGQGGSRHLVVNHVPVQQPVAYEYDRSGDVVWIDIEVLVGYMNLTDVSVQPTIEALAKYAAPSRSMAEGIHGLAGAKRPVLKLDLTQPVWASLKPSI